MTEKEKRDLGQIYNPNYDKELLKEMTDCKDLCFKYNNLKPSKEKERLTLLKKIFGSSKSIMAVQSPIWCDYGYNIKTGENFYANHGCTFLDCASITFGDNVFIGPNCSFYTPIHPLNAEDRNKGLEQAYPITVGNDVWFGGNVTVLPNITIGDNVVIGAGSVVTKDIPSNTIAFGNPCIVQRENNR